jgi:hypothetical protein
MAVRLVAGFILANSSVPLCSWSIQLANGLTTAMGIGTAAASVSSTFKDVFFKVINPTGGLAVALLGVVFLVAIVLVVCTFWLRLLLVILLVAVAPLALACHALPATQPVAMWWWKALAASLATQVAQSIVMAAAVPLLIVGDDDILSIATSPFLQILVAIILLWLMWKIPLWALHAVRGQPTRTPRILRYLLLNRAFNVAGAGAKRVWRSVREDLGIGPAAAAKSGAPTAKRATAKDATGIVNEAGFNVLDRRTAHASADRLGPFRVGPFGQRTLTPGLDAPMRGTPAPGALRAALPRKTEAPRRLHRARSILGKAARAAIGLGLAAHTGGGSLAATTAAKTAAGRVAGRAGGVAGGQIGRTLAGAAGKISGTGMRRRTGGAAPFPAVSRVRGTRNAAGRIKELAPTTGAPYRAARILDRAAAERRRTQPTEQWRRERHREAQTADRNAAGQQTQWVRDRHREAAEHKAAIQLAEIDKSLNLSERVLQQARERAEAAPQREEAERAHQQAAERSRAEAIQLKNEMQLAEIDNSLNLSQRILDRARRRAQAAQEAQQARQEAAERTREEAMRLKDAWRRYRLDGDDA